MNKDMGLEMPHRICDCGRDLMFNTDLLLGRWMCGTCGNQYGTGEKTKAETMQHTIDEYEAAIDDLRFCVMCFYNAPEPEPDGFSLLTPAVTVRLALKLVREMQSCIGILHDHR